jgi:hypothetical protein
VNRFKEQSGSGLGWVTAPADIRSVLPGRHSECPETEGARPDERVQ